MRVKRALEDIGYRSAYGFTYALSLAPMSLLEKIGIWPLDLNMNMYQYHDDEPYQNECFSYITNVKSDVSKRQFFNCVFRHCRFERSDFSGCNFINCQFIRCELYLVDVLDAGFRDSIFDECAIVGVEFSKCNASMLSFAFSRCVLDYSGFARTRIATTRFNSCSLRNVDFTGADLTGSSFANCDLSATRFAKSILDEADFESAYNFTIDPRLNRIKNASFSSHNIKGLLGCFDIKVHGPQSYCEQILDTLMLPEF